MLWLEWHFQQRLRRVKQLLPVCQLFPVSIMRGKSRLCIMAFTLMSSLAKCDFISFVIQGYFIQFLERNSEGCLYLEQCF